MSIRASCPRPLALVGRLCRSPLGTAGVQRSTVPGSLWDGGHDLRPLCWAVSIVPIWSYPKSGRTHAEDRRDDSHVINRRKWSDHRSAGTEPASRGHLSTHAALFELGQPGLSQPVSHSAAKDRPPTLLFEPAEILALGPKIEKQRLSRAKPVAARPAGGRWRFCCHG